MRLITGIVLLILSVGLLSCRWEAASSQATSAAVSTSWIRTATGWEKSGTWTTAATLRPALHPLVVASGEMLASILGMAAFSAGPNLDRRNRC
jgi:hypothetical protein